VAEDDSGTNRLLTFTVYRKAQYAVSIAKQQVCRAIYP
jgi:hypothetical protein